MEQLEWLRRARDEENEKNGGFETWGAAPNWYYEWTGWGTLMKRDASFDSAERLAFGAMSR